MARELQTKTPATTTALVAQNYALMKADNKAVSEILSANLGAHGSLDQFTLDRIKVPAGGGTTWTVPSLEGPQEMKEVNGIIIAWSEQRGYWETPFEESGGGSPPDCSSRDSVIGIGRPGGECLKCPLAQFGSADPKGKQKREDVRGQACKQVRLLFVLLENSMIPLVVSIPPTSLKGAKQYFLRLAGNSIPYYGVVTRLLLRKDKNKDGIEYSAVDFIKAGSLNEEQTAKARNYGTAFRPQIEATVMQQSDVDGSGAKPRE